MLVGLLPPGDTFSQWLTASIWIGRPLGFTFASWRWPSGLLSPTAGPGSGNRPARNRRYAQKPGRQRGASAARDRPALSEGHCDRPKSPLSMLLIVGAGAVLSTSLLHLMHVGPGFVGPRHLLTFSMDATPSRPSWPTRSPSIRIFPVGSAFGGICPPALLAWRRRPADRPADNSSGIIKSPSKATPPSPRRERSAHAVFIRGSSPR